MLKKLEDSLTEDGYPDFSADGMEMKDNMLFYKWTNFVRFPNSSGRIISFEERIDTSNSFYIPDDDSPKNSSAEYTKFGLTVTENQILWKGDEFESMRINNSGQVYVWTKYNVWTLLPEEGDKLVFLKRSPGYEKISNKHSIEYYNSETWRNFIMFPFYGGSTDVGERLDKPSVKHKSWFCNFLFSLYPSLAVRIGFCRKSYFGDKVIASRELIQKLTFSEYPLPSDSESHIHRFYNPNVPIKLIITESEFLKDDDELEKLKIDELGDVEIWTKYYSCVIRSAGGHERFIIVPRHPFAGVQCHFLNQ